MPFLQSRCKVCLNPDFKVKAFMKLCHQSLELRQLSEMSLCVRSGHQKYHSLSCLNRSCVSCSPDAVKTFLHSLCDPGSSQPVTWQKWDHAKTSGGKKHLELLEKQVSIETFVDELVEELKSLPIHQIAHHWQADKYKKLKACPPHGCAVVTLDFAQNFTCRLYFGPRHGKSACDALGGVIKTAAGQAVTRRHLKIADAEDTYSFCNSTMTKTVEGCCGSTRKFYLLSEVPRPEHGSDANTHLKTVPGTCNIKQHAFSCFCGPCLQEDYSRCMNLEIVSVWQKVKLAESRLEPFSKLEQIKDEHLSFDRVQKCLESCGTFEEFKSMCLKVDDLMPSFPLNSHCSVSVDHLKFSVDKLTSKDRPQRTLQMVTACLRACVWLSWAVT
ncbi:hypothetical protein PoB_004638900 [Plakobranchus ocellatus]|uniref:Uncharacterized protein n=1 Tax=Plakobranchus ocellatus TaxID=259542 RepID=A0AAV4BLV0_9GAST|nr:hypothetical protein PoB_004638900 [Plakobranchus ocellatus]